MKKLKKILSVLLVACMLLGMLPAINVAAADADAPVPGKFMEVATVTTSGGWGGSQTSRYLSTVGSNAFNVFMYDNTFSGTFGDQHMGGIEFSLNGTRIATNGDLHLLPTPEQWDATPAPSKGSVSVDAATNVITVPMTFTGSPDGTLRYDLVATPTDKGVCLQMILKTDMPEDLKGKARFNLEFLPSAYESKTYQADLNADGVYDTFGTFPLHAQDAMVDTERANLPSQAWYVKEWNADRGDAQPLPFATAYGFTFSPEDSKTHITITSQTDDQMELYDGRNRAQNGWYVLSTLISATKAGEVAAQWNIVPEVEEGWVRTPNVGFSQVGYTPNQLEKFAVVELDKWDENYPKTASLYRLNADGTEDLVCEKELGALTNWMRFKYARFDFSEVKVAGLYRIHYGDQICEVFPIATDVYDNIWQSCLSGFLAVQMDHIEVREGYKIWHGASHMDDGRLPPSSPTSWFDGMSAGSIPQSVRNLGYTNDQHVDGLNQGGWFDAGDFDLQMNSNFTVWGNLIATAEATNNMDGYDTLAVTWNEATGGTAEMHRPDGVPDIVQQVIHGSKQVLAQYEALGGCGGTMEVRALRQYTHLGDPSSDTDGYIYDPTLGEDEIVERDGKVYSGVNDDRYLLMAGGGGSFSTNMWNRAPDFAATAYLAAPYYPEYAARVMNAAIKILKDERGGTISGSDFSALVQYTLASDALEKYGIEYDDCETYSAAYFREILDGALDSAINSGVGSNTSLLYLIPLLGDEYKARLVSSVKTYASSNSTVNNNPYGVNWTSGASWGGSPNTFQGMRVPSLVYYNFPEEAAALEQNILRSVNYLLGRHPATNASWISGVGTKSALHPYNSNRAEESFIPGSILPGHITFSDYVESMDDFSFLWFEGESIVTYQSNWVAVGLAASKIANKEAAPDVAEAKDFTSSVDLKMVKTETTSFFGTTTDGYLADDGFNVLMYSTTFDRTFGDQHCAGIELIQNGRRVATNGDIHLLPTPEQWDATPAPTRGERTFDEETNTITVNMTIPAETLEDGTENPAISYQLIAEPEEGGVKLTIKLDENLPADVVGKAGFNLEFLPAVFISKSIQADSDGDGNYDVFRTFPLTPFDEMEDVDRTRTANQVWYVQEWNEERGNAQPLPLAEGYKMTFAAEDDDYRIRISCDDGLALYDGRNRAQNGWFVLRTLIPEDKTEIVWHISPDTNDDWVREPNITHSQVGYEPELSKTAVIELDANYVGSDEATLKRLNDDGTYTAVYTGALSEATTWKRYHYRDFDFSSVKAPGTYVIDYDGTVSDPFPIVKHAYADTWQTTVGNFLAVQMDHVKVREGYKIWHNVSHFDDALQAPTNVSWFDGWSMGDTCDSGYEAYEHIDGLNVGGFYDAGDFDIQTNTNLELINYLSNAYQVFGNDYDTLDCNWDTRYVELHRPDGIADIPELVKHGALQILGQLDATGFLASVIEVQSLRQYTHLGDGAKDTDNKVYDPTLGEDEVDGLRSGKTDDRLAFFSTKSSYTQTTAGAALAQAYDVIKSFDPETAARCLAWAEKIWEEDASAGNWNMAIELFYATGKDVYKNYILENFETQMASSGGGWFSTTGFSAAGYRAGKILDKLDAEYTEKYNEGAATYDATVLVATNPFGVSDTFGMWGGAGTVIGNAAKAAFVHKYAPEAVSAEHTFRAVNYILGTHPYNSTSWVSAVGQKSVEKGYGSNRADRYYIAGGVVPGYVTVAPDFPEHMDDYNFLWFENEYCIAPSAQWVFLAQAAEEFARENDIPCEHEYTSKVTAPTCTKGGYTTYFCNKCFESYVGDETEALGHSWDEGRITRKPTSTREGIKTFTCTRCGSTMTEPVPATGVATETKIFTIDFTNPADAEKFTVTGGDADAAIVEGEGLTLISNNTCIEPAKNQRAVVMGEDNVIHVPVSGDWTATFEFDFDANGSSGGYEFFGFYAAAGGDYKNMVGIRGGNGAMQDFIIQDGTVTQQEQNSSSPGLTSAAKHWYKIEKIGDTYICYRSSDGESFTEMFTFESTNIEADEIVIDAYSGMATGYTYILKNLEIATEVAISSGKSVTIDFTKPADASKFEIIGATEGTGIKEGEGLTLVTTRNAIETCNGRNSDELANTPEDLVSVPVSGDWTATLEYDFSQADAANGYYQFFGFFASDGDDYQNMAGIRGGDGAMQNFLRVDGEITADTNGVNYEPGLSENGTYWYRITKSGTSYICEVSRNGEDFTEMFSYEDTGVEADSLIIDAYTGMTAGYTFTLKYLEIQGEGAPDVEAAYVPAISIEGGKQYVIVADGKLVLNNDAQAKPIEIVDGKIDPAAITEDMLWNFEDVPASVAVPSDGNPMYYIYADSKAEGSNVLQRGSGSGGENSAAIVQVAAAPSTGRWSWWSFVEREDGSYTMHANTERDHSSDYAFTINISENDVNCTNSYNPWDDLTTSGSAITLYELGTGTVAPCKHENTEIRDAKDATCTEAGYTGDTYCTDCGKRVSKGQTIAALGHDWNEGEVTKQATCTEAGVKTYTCKREGCTETKTETIAALGHKWDDGKVTTEPTCGTAGVKTYTCATCKATKTESIPATGEHTWGDWTVTTPAATLTDGEETRTCTVCGATETRVIPMLGFEDVPADRYYYNSVMWAAKKGITTGVDETHFAPNADCTRAQAVMFLWNAAGCPEVAETVTNPFTDVTEGRYYYKAVLWAISNGITNGTDDTHFSPNKKLDRATFVTFLWRAKGEVEVPATDKFTDVKPGKFYTTAVAWAVANGITEGKTDTTFAPTALCTRAQVVTFLQRAYGE